MTVALQTSSAKTATASFRLLPSAFSSPGFALATGWGLTYRRAMEKSQLAQYVPVLMLAVVAVGCTAGMILFSVLLGKRGRRGGVKDTAYECGMIPQGEGAGRFTVKFYLVAMLFILFDIEVVFLYPWAAIYKDMLKDPATRDLILGAMVSFLASLFAGYLYALKKRAFDWRS
jgi:NADH-quinone oxidoreductase subunit A